MGCDQSDPYGCSCSLVQPNSHLLYSAYRAILCYPGISLMKRNSVEDDDISKRENETMHITELTLQTHDLAAQRDFYEHTLELPVLEASEQAFTVQAGTTRLTFQATEQEDVLYHVAFTVPRNKIAQA